MSQSPWLTISGRTVPLTAQMVYLGGAGSVDAGFGDVRLGRLQVDSLGHLMLVVENGVSHVVTPAQKTVVDGRRYQLDPATGPISIILNGHAADIEWQRRPSTAAPPAHSTTPLEPPVPRVPQPVRQSPPVPMANTHGQAAGSAGTTASAPVSAMPPEGALHELPATGGGSQWTFSIVGVVWLVIAVLLFISLDPIGMLIGLVALAYSVYLFRGGRFKFLVW